VLLIGFVFSCLGGPAHAEEADDLIRRGVECRRKRDDAGALRLFQQAYEMDHGPRALAQMGLAEQALGKWVPAFEHLRAALAVNGDPWVDKHRTVLKDAVARVADHVGFVEIFGGSTGAEVRVDGIVRGTLPLPKPMVTTTGTVAVDLSMVGHLPIRRTTTVRSQETTREAFDDLPTDSRGTSSGETRDDGSIARRVPAVADGTPSPSAQGKSVEATPTAPEPDRPGGDSAEAQNRSAFAASARWPLVIGTAALSLGALIFATVEYSHWSGNVDSFNRMSCDPRLSDRGSATCASLYGDAQHEKTLMYVGYGAASVLAVTSAVLFFALDQGKPAGHQIACLPSPASGSVSCALRF
jgi:hypothetical protein